MKQVFTKEIGGRQLTVEIGEMAQLANGSCLVRYGDTVVLSAATASREPRAGIDFFPLSVDYEEKMYAVGRFPGGFRKREGRPSDAAILVARAIDRPMRPLFPKDLRNDVCLSNLVLSSDQDNDPAICAMIGSSIAVSISDIPWNGPTASIVLGLRDGEVLINPSVEEKKTSEMEVTLAGTRHKICMIEAAANEVPDEEMVRALEAGHAVIREICDFILEIVAACGREKFSYESAACPSEILEFVDSLARDRMREAVLAVDKTVRDDAIAGLKSEIEAEVVERFAEDGERFLAEAIDKLEKSCVRDYLFHEHRRVDGRRLDEIRPLSAAVGLLPRTHGSALFQRGQTQVLTVCTLSQLSDSQTLDNINPETEQRYLHQYNFPSYSVGEARPNRSPGRREIGHGALAERALVPVLPTTEEFPYAIRNVSEVTMSNGSTSQASVCASTLALMDAGVPIKRPVAGISSGLIVNPEDDSDYLVFMDIQGIEDFFGDMDFKVAGTREGITSIQVDIKVDGLSLDIIRDAFAMTKKGRMQILDEVILKTLEKPRETLSPYAPKILQTTVPVDKIREVIGQGGKVINRIIDETNTQIDIEDDGRIFIAYYDEADGQAALKMVEGIVSEPTPGETYVGTVTRLMNFGAFVEYLPFKEGLVHISKMAYEHVESVEDVVSVGDEVRVWVSEVDDQGRINLDMRDPEAKPEGYEERRSQASRERSNGSSRRYDRRDSGRGRSERPHGGRRYDERNSDGPRRREDRNSEFSARPRRRRSRQEENDD
ncbi:MAG: polyribonucleotide nucleotidyltransferase [Eubacteriales bacterium]|nr:polyribonucleotide nucleotidyltransferase [Eubacteriales bacterium]